MLCRTYWKNGVIFPVVLYCQQNDSWTEEKYWVFWTLFFFVFGVKNMEDLFFFQWCGVLLLLFFSVAGLSAPWMSIRVLCYSNTFRFSLGVRSTVPLCKSSHSTYQYIGLNSPKVQLKFSHTKTLSLSCVRSQMAEFFSTTFQGRGGFRGRVKLGHSMPHFHNPVRLRRSPGSVTAAGTLQSPGAAPNSAVFRADWIKHHLWPLLL